MVNMPPNALAFLLGEGGDWNLPGDIYALCQGAVFHSPRPLFVHETPLILKSWGNGLTSRAPTRMLCGTCRDNLTLLLTMLHHTEGHLDWAIRREFGNDLRALALTGWNWYRTVRPAQPAPAPPKG